MIEMIINHEEIDGKISLGYQWIDHDLDGKYFEGEYIVKEVEQREVSSPCYVYFSVSHEYIKKVFLENDTIILFEDGFTMADIMVDLGIFASKTQARKNNWGQEIPRGWNKYYVGKNRTLFYTYRPLFVIDSIHLKGLVP